MKNARKLHWLILLAFVFAFWIASTAAAQNTQAAQVNVNYAQVDESAGQQVRVYFNVLDPAGQVVTNPTVSGAQLTVNGQTYPGVISVPDLPLNIVLVLDASGSMEPAAAAMRAAAIQAVNSAPQNARFAVYQFNETMVPRTNFTEDRGTIIDAIGSITDDQFDGGTCLYDATADAITALQNAGGAGRRAVIVFTDGRDELIAGGALDPCSTRADLASVISAARRPQLRVPIYTIGMTGTQPISQNELEQMAAQTGGRSAFGAQADLNALFQQIITALASQRQATFTPCLAAGAYGGFVNIQVESSAFDVPVDALTFSTSCDVPTATPTPQPLTLSLTTPIFNREANALRFAINRQGDGEVARYEVEVVEQETGILVRSDDGSFDGNFDVEPAQAHQVSISLDNLPLTAWTIRVRAYAAEGQLLAETAVNNIRPPRPTATPSPEPFAMTISPFRFDEASRSVEFRLTSSGTGEVDRYRIRIIDKATGGLIASEQYAESEYPAQPGETQIRVPLDAISAETINVIVQALDADGNVLGGGISGDYSPARTPTPTPTNIPTQTPTPTAAPPLLNIPPITFDETGQQFILDLQTQNIPPDQITGYTVRVVTREGAVPFTEERVGAPDDPLRIDARTTSGGVLLPGEYTLQVELRLRSGSPITAQQQTSRPALPPTATPLPPMETLALNLQTNPLLGIGFVLFVLGVIILVIITVLSRRTRRIRYDVSPFAQQRGSRRALSAVTSTTQEEARTTDVFVESKTQPDHGAQLKVLKSEGYKAGHLWEFNRHDVPVRVGRGGNENFPVAVDLRDTSVSRLHASILHDGSHYYLVQEKQGSVTTLDNMRLEVGKRYRLASNQQIGLGRTVLIFTDYNEEFRKRIGAGKPAESALTPPAVAPAPPDVTSEAEPLPEGVTARVLIVKSQDAQMQSGKTIAVTTREFVIGRGETADLRLNARGVSGTHALIRWEAKRRQFTITDLNSRNGTTVDVRGEESQRLEPDQPFAMSVRTEYIIGLGTNNQVQFSYQLSKSNATASADATEVEAPSEAEIGAPDAAVMQEHPTAGAGEVVSDAAHAVAVASAQPARDDDVLTNVILDIEIVLGITVPPHRASTSRRLIRLGRRAESSDFIFDSPKISRDHARIFWSETDLCYFVEDLNSTNGTFVDDSPVMYGTPTRLTPGVDHALRLGKADDTHVLLRLRYFVGEQPTMV